jgi:hypothetical protein
VIFSRLRGGPAGAARGAKSFLTETISRLRHAGATGQLTVRADSAFYYRAALTTARTFGVRFSVTARQDKKIRAAIAAPFPRRRGCRSRMALHPGRIRRGRGRDELHLLRSHPGCDHGAAGRAPGASHPRLAAGVGRPAARSRPNPISEPSRPQARALPIINSARRCIRAYSIGLRSAAPAALDGAGATGRSP